MVSLDCVHVLLGKASREGACCQLGQFPSVAARLSPSFILKPVILSIASDSLPLNSKVFENNFENDV